MHLGFEPSSRGWKEEKQQAQLTVQLIAEARGVLHSPRVLPDHIEEHIFSTDIALLQSEWKSDSPIVLGYVKTQAKILKTGCPP